MLATMEQEPKQADEQLGSQLPGVPVEGIRCRRCGSTRLKVKKTLRRADNRVWRYRQCSDCGYRGRTDEAYCIPISDHDTAKIIKNNHADLEEE